MNKRLASRCVRVVPLLALASVAVRAQTPPHFLYIYRDSLKSGVDSAYRAIENDGAQICADFRCPNPYLGLESLSGTHEAWWINEFGNVADTLRVSRAYATNRPLAEALGDVAKRKAPLIGTPIQGFASYRRDLSHGPSWSIAGAHFIVVSITRDPRPADGAVWSMGDSAFYVMRAAHARAQAEEIARRTGGRVFAVRPNWSMPAQSWIKADPRFWRDAPARRR